MGRLLLGLAVLLACFSSAAYAAGGNAAPPPSPALSALNPEFFVATYGASGADASTSSMLSLGVGTELYKEVARHLSPAAAPWIIPQPQWTTDDLARRCATDPQAIGGVAIVYYQGYATHFYLLWQSETTTLDLFAEVIVCNHSASRPPPATGIVVATIMELPGANGTDWQVRRTQVSIPLITLAGAGSVLAKGSTANKGGTNLTTSVLLGSIFNQASSRDIPGYSDPIRLRHAAQHVGVDVVFAMHHFCNPAQGEPAPSPQLASLCTALGLSR
ncbi:MAG: hypothetical protein ACYC8W_07005 [Candidatus Tyrphobacter sp.]